MHYKIKAILACDLYTEDYILLPIIPADVDCDAEVTEIGSSVASYRAEAGIW